jgi:hypothetical protein
MILDHQPFVVRDLDVLQHTAEQVLNGHEIRNFKWSIFAKVQIKIYTGLLQLHR